MGAAIAERLREVADPVLWNRSPSELLDRFPRRRRPTAEEAADGADVVITCLTADAAVREVLGSITPVLRPGVVLIDCSTVSPDTARQTAQALDERGVYFVDAPVSGGPEAARRGALTLMCGGSPESFAAARSALALFGEQIIYLGPAGSGQVGKAVNQVILAGSLLGVAEGVALARRSGIDADRLIAGIQRGAAASWVLSNRSDMMLSGDFTPKGRLALHHKDLLIAQQLARTAGMTLPGVDLVTDLESQAIHAGHGDDDIAAIITALD
jgi:3-hydroxyisobutyrate dehydrogenase-like beta-hydroxyacid dehydrogenase